MIENTLSVIIVTYNRCNDLKDSLNALCSMNVDPTEIIVVDSNSSDGTCELVKKYPVKFITIKERSMVRARNVGLKQAKGDIVAYIDDDAIVSKDWSKHILEPYERNDVGGVGGRVLPFGKSDVKISDIPENFRKIGKLFDNGFVSNNYDLSTRFPIEVDVLIGCNMTFRRNLLLKAGGFDENFKGSCFRDDTDASTRIKNLNYKLIYCPSALLWHKYRGKTVNRKWFYWYSYNHFYFCFKNFQPINIRKFINLIHGAFFPPIGYIKKSGISIKPEPLVALTIIKGILEANKAYKMGITRRRA
jgi:GT2 family glycosyltransferase